MKTTITVTSKGQATLPAPIRRKLGLDSSGGVLQISFNESKGELIISRPVRARELSERLSRYIKPGTKPLMNADEYYQAARQHQ